MDRTESQQTKSELNFQSFATKPSLKTELKTELETELATELNTELKMELKMEPLQPLDLCKSLFGLDIRNR
jgi:hypothetical protein